MDSFIASVVLGLIGVIFAMISLLYLVWKFFGRKFNELVMLTLVFISFLTFLIGTQLFDGEVAAGIDENDLLLSETQAGFELSFVPVGFGAASLFIQIIITILDRRQRRKLVTSPSRVKRDQISSI